MTTTFTTVSLADLATLDAGRTLVLTVNNRLARRIVAEMSASLGSGRKVMAVPDILPLSAWLTRVSDQLAFVPEARLAAHTVDSFGSQFLWQRVIAQAEPEHALLDITQAARLAAEADRIVDEWRIAVAPELETMDYQRFMEWRDRYRSLLSDMDMDDSNMAYETICRSIEQGLLELPFQEIVLAGFNDISPRFASLIAAMQGRGFRLHVLELPGGTATQVQRVAAPDPDSEWRMAAQWAAECLRAHPNGRYAIVAARLEADVALAHRTLRATLDKDTADRQVPYNVAVARPLSEWPLARAALAWLRVIAQFGRGGPCAPADLGQALLAGGCAGGADEAPGRAIIDALWRKRAVVKVSEADFSRLLLQHAPQLGAAWTACAERRAAETAAADAGAWSKRYRAWLEALGFPGSAVLDSHSYQVMDAFDGLLDRYARQSVAVGRIAPSGAVALLLKMARETPFQPQRDPSARLDVLGFLESEGGRWDGVWVLGLTDDVLPAVPRPNPFIPLAALRQANAPRATPDRELHWARAMYAALLECAPHVWLSHAQMQGETELRPSPCIADIPLAAPAATPGPATPCVLEYVRDDTGPALLAGKTTAGGIGVIDTQARNPLWAFVKYRLGASQLGDYADISDQNARGVFLHRAIELVWRLLPDQEALRAAYAQGRVAGLLEQAVAQAADECLQDYGAALRSLETNRALKVLDAWLQSELARAPFRVQDVEQEYQWTHGPLQLSLRLDRIDELHDGRLAVIDYKSGDGNIDPRPDWMRPRPVGLQLPFYAAVLAKESHAVAALVLARLHARDVQVKGLVDGDYRFEGLATLDEWPAFAGYTWERLMNEWRGAIQGLAEEYASGVACNRSARPDDIKYCDVLPFLRLTEEYKHGD
ncbi:MAG TPA: PD-(D/E)XK nuclease family protein [Candidimonas sp.]|nr:PD-(D/E)XK nuclease family protein [Candidimonas sp.]